MKQPTDSPINFKSEKDFLSESASLLELLSDTRNFFTKLESNWEKRMNALNTIKNIVMGTTPDLFPDSFDKFLINSVSPLSCQVSLLMLRHLI